MSCSEESSSMEQESSHGSPNMERTNWVHRRINVSTKVRVTKYLKKASKNIFTLAELLGHYIINGLFTWKRTLFCKTFINRQ